jgi:hypothetical protein
VGDVSATTSGPPTPDTGGRPHRSRKLARFAVRIDAQAAGTGTLILAQIDGSTLTPLQTGPSP